jgi:hypothetical protein
MRWWIGPREGFRWRATVGHPTDPHKGGEERVEKNWRVVHPCEDKGDEMSDPRNQLRDIVSEGLAIDIFEAEESIALSWMIGNNATEINKATFGAFFGSIQRIIGRHGVLAVSRLYEPYSKRYPIRSIPAALKALREHAGVLKIEQKHVIGEKLHKDGFASRDLAGISDKEATLRLVESFEHGLPQISKAHIDDLSRMLEGVKEVRDKTIAHHEIVDAGKKPSATYAELDHLIEYAKNFACVVGAGYLSVMYGTADDYILTSDAKRASICLNRMLVKAAVIEDKRFSRRSNG